MFLKIIDELMLIFKKDTYLLKKDNKLLINQKLLQQYNNGIPKNSDFVKR